VACVDLELLEAGAGARVAWVISHAAHSGAPADH
jgi:hypothetical protein